MFDRRLLSNFDWFFFLLVIVISMLGVAAIYSASLGYSEPTQYWLRQLIWMGLGFMVAFIVLLFDFRTIGGMAYFIHGGVVFLLVLLALSSLWRGGGVNRWFVIGSVAIQPSEFVKLSLVLAVAHYFRDIRRVNDLGLRGLFWPAAMLFAPFFLIVNQPDLGTALMLVLIFIPMVLLAGVRMRIIVALGVAGLLSIAALIASFQFGYYEIDAKIISQLRREGAAEQLLTNLGGMEGERLHGRENLHDRLLEGLNGNRNTRFIGLIEKKSFVPYISKILRPYQQRRLITFINPDYDPLGAGYHIIQSKVAIGSGKFWGKGYRQSTQGSLNFLPARHTDFLFSIFAEEWGFFGAVLLVMLYLTLILRGLSTMLQTHDRFSSFLTLGVVSIIAFQVLINMGMAVGMLPVVGVPLPLFSYGGSSVVTIMVCVGLILNIRMRRFLWS